MCWQGSSQTPLNKAEIDSLVNLPKRTEFEKFLSRLVATQLDAGPQTRINNFFHALDRRGDGALSTEALAMALKSMGLAPELAEQVARELDVAKRGRVSYTEFLAGFLDFRTRSPAEQDDILRLAWHQFSPCENGQVKTNEVQNALAARGMTVADIPSEFLLALKKDASGYLTFSWFKNLLVPGSGSLTPPASEKKRRNFFERLFA
jgi:Ca2+-binding EF-hand superfamily protein